MVSNFRVTRSEWYIADQAYFAATIKNRDSMMIRAEAFEA
jgi:hypothetical protein